MITQSAFTQVEQRGSVDMSTSQVLGIDVSGISAILNILTNMYSNPSLAVVREYSCNARDSHVESGKGHLPIEVFLPTPLDPQLKVQDYGLGLTQEEILNTYAKYGSSTKRASNELIGAMGIGSKSAFTVGNQFTVTGVKNGVKTIALFALNAHGEPTVNILHHGATTESNGVLVDIGVENVSAVNDAAKHLFSTWKPGTVKVDGKFPESVWTHCEEITPTSHLMISEETGGYTFKIVMGGVSYQLNNTAVNSLNRDARDFINRFNRNKAKFYLTVPIGAVDITPSREELRVTPHTTQTLERVLGELELNLRPWINKRIEDAPTFMQAARLAYSIGQQIGYVDYKTLVWHGHTITEANFRLQHPSFWLKQPRVRYNTTVGRLTTVKHDTTYVGIETDPAKLLFVINTPEDKYTTVRRYVKAWLIANTPEGDKSEIVVVASSLAAEERNWFQYGKGGEIRTIEYEDWREEGRKLTKVERAKGGVRNEPTYDFIGDDGTPSTAKELKELDSDIVFYSYGHYYPYNDVFVKTALKDKTVVILRKGQQASTFKTRVPGSVPATEAVEAYAQKIIDNLSASDLDILQRHRYLSVVNQGHANWLMKHKALITNKRARDFIKFHAQAVQDAQGSNNRLQMIQQANAYIRREIVVSDVPEAQFVIKNFPLLAVYLNNHYAAHNIVMPEDEIKHHVIGYINDRSI